MMPRGERRARFGATLVVDRRRVGDASRFKFVALPRIRLRARDGDRRGVVRGRGRRERGRWARRGAAAARSRDRGSRRTAGSEDKVWGKSSRGQFWTGDHQRRLHDVVHRELGDVVDEGACGDVSTNRGEEPRTTRRV